MSLAHVENSRTFLQPQACAGNSTSPPHAGGLRCPQNQLNRGPTGHWNQILIRAFHAEGTWEMQGRLGIGVLASVLGLRGRVMVPIFQRLLSSTNIYSAGDAFPVLDMNSPARQGLESLGFRIGRIPAPALPGTLRVTPGKSLSLSFFSSEPQLSYLENTQNPRLLRGL